ncbi:hypothetical protein OsJ_05520 [Oryza sativa Japonica Group]|uniref:ALOG domain-containing protein n=1 Tax=Oryza sativa subsp. japonica TaxID=39947 RepID=A3A3I2_ORYSJ|nr:hypothetical protein OsJ_05520 [Oryza sativa Japonica Group]
MASPAESPGGGGTARPSRYESQKRRDWQTFGQYLRNHRPPLELSRCSGAHVLEFLRYLDQFGKTKVHAHGCPFFGHPSPPAPCPCPLRQAWGSLDALVGRFRAAFEEHGGRPESNPFGARAVRLYLGDIRDTQSKARGIAYEKKRRQGGRGFQHQAEAAAAAAGGTGGGAARRRRRRRGAAGHGDDDDDDHGAALLVPGALPPRPLLPGTGRRAARRRRRRGVDGRRCRCSQRRRRGGPGAGHGGGGGGRRGARRRLHDATVGVQLAPPSISINP